MDTEFTIGEHPVTVHSTNTHTSVQLWGRKCGGCGSRFVEDPCKGGVLERLEIPHILPDIQQLVHSRVCVVIKLVGVAIFDMDVDDLGEGE